MQNTELSIYSKIQSNRVLIFGASGFLGKHILASITEPNIGIDRIICCARSNNKLHQLMTYGSPDQIITVPFDVMKIKNNIVKLKSILSKVSTVIYCVGDLFANGKENILYNIAPTLIADISYKQGIKKFVYISALGANLKANSNYMSAKKRGEQNILKVNPTATIIRPSYVFGKNDNLICKYAKYSLISYILPLPKGGKTLLSPVSAFDVAKACKIIISSDKWLGRKFNFFSNNPLSIKNILELTIKACKRRRLLVSLPLFLIWPSAWINDLLGLKIISRDQLRMLKTNSIPTDKKGMNFSALGINPNKLSDELYNILKRYRDGTGRTIEPL